jgi:hypothetical protein
MRLNHFSQFCKAQWMREQDQAKYLHQEQVEVLPPSKFISPILDLDMEGHRRKGNLMKKKPMVKEKHKGNL